jgi:hypothetical protein
VEKTSCLSKVVDGIRRSTLPFKVAQTEILVFAIQMRVGHVDGRCVDGGYLVGSP